MRRSGEDRGKGRGKERKVRMRREENSEIARKYYKKIDYIEKRSLALMFSCYLL